MKASISIGKNVSHLNFNYQFTYRNYGAKSKKTYLDNCNRLFNECDSMKQMFASCEVANDKYDFKHAHVLIETDDFELSLCELQKKVNCVKLYKEERRVLIKKEYNKLDVLKEGLVAKEKSTTYFKEEWVTIDSYSIVGKKEIVFLEKILGKENIASYITKQCDWGINYDYWKR
jgi:hypothetical protein